MATAHHLLLAGDSIFDNDAYVGGEPGVIEQLRKSMPSGWSAHKVAVDGDCIRDVPRQLAELPPDATDLIVSVGGNDMLGYSDLLSQIESAADIERVLARPIATFAAEYGALLDHLMALPARCSVCTVYTAIPFEEPLWRQFVPFAIGAFNAAIVEQAAARGIPVFRLDEVCTEVDDFSAASPIEPSAKGGQKIVDHILAGLVS